MQAAELYHTMPEIKSTVELDVSIDLSQMKYFYPSFLYVIMKYYIASRCKCMSESFCAIISN